MNLETLLDKDAIADVVHQLFVATDQRDWDAVRAALAPRLRVDMSSLTGIAPSDIDGTELATMWETGLRPIQAVHHQIGNLRIAVDGDSAQAFCYGTATHYRPTASGDDVRSFVGSYDLQLQRMDGAWCIVLFRFNLKYVDGNLQLETDG
ncbi:nuclear transport factor 2 family protein [Lysobacter yangpyeongensis]|uniref:Nuclear transport factor 2 family protein n=1 Tax=Lysobacter yangpyeongensis TaxID=346182 RepID=A0ABW0SKE8_9GAMM